MLENDKSVIMLQSHIDQRCSGQNELECLRLNRDAAAPVDGLIAALLYEIHTGLWQLAS